MMVKVRVLLIGSRTMEQAALEFRLSIDDRVTVETVQDAVAARSLIQWRPYNLVIVNLVDTTDSLIELIRDYAEQSRGSCISFFGGKSAKLAKTAELLAQARGLILLQSLVKDLIEDGAQVFGEFVSGAA